MGHVGRYLNGMFGIRVASQNHKDLKWFIDDEWQFDTSLEHLPSSNSYKQL